MSKDAKKQNLEEMKIEALRRQDNLAADIDELLDRINPKNAIQRMKNEAVSRVQGLTSEAGAKNFFVDAGGSVKPAPVAGVVAGAVGTLALIGGLVLLATRTPKDGEYFNRRYSGR